MWKVFTSGHKCEFDSLMDMTGCTKFTTRHNGDQMSHTVYAHHLLIETTVCKWITADVQSIYY